MKAHILCGVAGVAMLAACGGTQGTTESTGHSSELLSVASHSATYDIASAMGREFAGTCVLNDGTNDVLVVAGGKDLNTGNVTDDILIFSPTASTKWTSLKALTPSVHLTNARLMLQGINTGTHACVFVGGTTAISGAAGMTDVDELTVSAGTYTITSKQSLHQGRSNFGLSSCGGSKLIVVAGRSNGTALKDIEVSNSLSPTTWTQTTTSGTSALNTTRSDFGFAKDANGDHYFVAGGFDGLSRLSSVEMINTSSCAPSKVTQTASALTSVVEGNVAFFEGTSNTFLSAGGRIAATNPNNLQTAVDKVLVNDWTGSVAPTLTKGFKTFTGGAYRPTLVESGSTHILLGGSDAAIANAVDRVWEYAASPATATLNSARYGAVAGFIGTTVYAAHGDAFGSYPLGTEVITP